MSKNKQQFETGIVINNKSQGNTGRYWMHCDIFNENLLQIHR